MNSPGASVRLSLSMIVKNEERFLEECLQSVQGVVDEIVIVDTGSTDRTKEIAARYNATIIDFVWTGDFSAARNFSLDHCSGEWILYLDADERLDSRHHQHLRKLLNDRRVTAYNVLIEGDHSTEAGKLSQANAYPRLFRRLPQIRFEGRVHEQIWPSLQRMNAVVRQSSLVIKHLGYAQGYDVVKEKALRNLDLLRAQAQENPADGYAWFQIGNTLVVLRRYDEAQPALHQALQQRLDRSVKASCLNLLAEVKLRSGKLDEAITHLAESLRVAPRQLMAHWFLALIAIDRGEHAEALRHLDDVDGVLGLPPAERANQVAADLDLKRDEVGLTRARVYEASGDIQRAADEYKKLSNLVPARDDVISGFATVAAKLPKDAGLSFLSSLPRNLQNVPVISLAIARAALACHDFSTAMQAAQRVVENENAHPDAHVILVLACSQSGDARMAESFLHAALAKGIRHFELYKYGLSLALNKGDISNAFQYLEMMAQTTTADLSPLRHRLQALAARVSNLPA